MKRVSLFFAVLTVSFLIAGSPAVSLAQAVYSTSDESSIVVNGTSNKSEWSVKAEKVEGTVELEDGTPTAAHFVLPVTNLKSGRSLIMDRLMKGSFGVAEHPNIEFVMVSAEAVEENVFDVEGELSMAGVTNPVTIRLTRSEDETGFYTFTGESGLDMRDYEMDAPSAMFGALRTKPEVVIQFILKLTS